MTLKYCPDTEEMRPETAAATMAVFIVVDVVAKECSIMGRIGSIEWLSLLLLKRKGVAANETKSVAASETKGAAANETKDVAVDDRKVGCC